MCRGVGAVGERDRDKETERWRGRERLDLAGYVVCSGGGHAHKTSTCLCLKMPDRQSFLAEW